MRSKSEIQEFAGMMFMLGQIETKANEEWANDFAVSIRNYVVELFNEGMASETPKEKRLNEIYRRVHNATGGKAKTGDEVILYLDNEIKYYREKIERLIGLKEGEAE